MCTREGMTETPAQQNPEPPSGSFDPECDDAESINTGELVGLRRSAADIPRLEKAKPVTCREIILRPLSIPHVIPHVNNGKKATSEKKISADKYTYVYMYRVSGRSAAARAAQWVFNRSSLF